jgi:hypothetical protein
MRDRLGFEQGKRHDAQGRPLKLQTPPPSQAYRDNYDAIFRKRKTVKKEKVDGR